MPTLADFVKEWNDRQPHPKAPSLTVGEFPVAMKLATVLKFGQGHASPQEATMFWREYQGMNQTLQAQGKQPLGAEEFTQLVQQMATSSFAYHGRPPTMYEIGRLRDAHPQDIHKFYGALPDQQYPTVPAADMAKALHAAKPWANLYLNREPVKLEAATLHHSGESPDSYYKRISDGSQDQTGPLAGVPGVGDAGGQQADQRAVDSGLATGAAAAGGTDGLPSR